VVLCSYARDARVLHGDCALVHASLSFCQFSEIGALARGGRLIAAGWMHVFIADVGPTFGRFHSPTASSQRGDVGIHSDRWNDLRRRTLFLVGMAPGEQSNPDLTNAGSLQKPMSRTFIDPDGGGQSSQLLAHNQLTHLQSASESESQSARCRMKKTSA
jgi:hypothetical protein